MCLLGFEIDGLDHLPDNGPAMIIYYHGVIPIDIYYIIATCLLEKGRVIHAVGDKFLFWIPGEPEAQVFFLCWVIEKTGFSIRCLFIFYYTCV